MDKENAIKSHIFELSLLCTTNSPASHFMKIKLDKIKGTRVEIGVNRPMKL